MKLPRAINVVLLVVGLAGLTLFVREKQRQVPLVEEADRLHSLLGDLKVVDPGKVYIRAIPTDCDLDFSWSVYLPKGYMPSSFALIGGSNHRTYPRQPCTPLQEPSQFVLRMKLSGTSRSMRSGFGGGDHPHVRGGKHSWLKPDDSGTHSIGVALSQPERLTIQQLGVEQTVAFTKDDDIELLKIVSPRSEKMREFVVCEFRLASEKYAR